MSEDREPLALKYRPGKFTDLVGQKPSAVVLYRETSLKNLPPAMLFWGQKGCGKTTSARIVAKALNCTAETGPAESWPCGECASCYAIENQVNPDVMELDAASNGGVERMKELRESVLYGTGGEYRVVILDEAHSITGSGYDALLTILEEPPPSTLFILCTTEPAKVKDTVRNRCQRFRFRPISELMIADRLRYICRNENIPADDVLLTGIAESAGGSMRDAIMQLDQVASAGVTSADMWRELTGEDDYATKLIAAAAAGDYPGLFGALDEALYTCGDYSEITRQIVRCLRDMTVLTTGEKVTATGEALRIRKELARQLGPQRLFAAFRVLWDLQTKVRAEDRRQALEIAVAMLSEKLCPPAGASPRSAAPAAPAPASTADMRALLG